MVPAPLSDVVDFAPLDLAQQAASRATMRHLDNGKASEFSAVGDSLAGTSAT